MRLAFGFLLTGMTSYLRPKRRSNFLIRSTFAQRLPGRTSHFACLFSSQKCHPHRQRFRSTASVRFHGLRLLLSQMGWKDRYFNGITTTRCSASKCALQVCASAMECCACAVHISVAHICGLPTVLLVVLKSAPLSSGGTTHKASFEIEQTPGACVCNMCGGKRELRKCKKRAS